MRQTLLDESGQPDPSDEPSDEMVRVGSPFSAGSQQPIQRVAPRATPLTAEQVHDVGVLRYTAMGAVVASVFVAFFAAIAVFWFPVGGILIAGLGCVLSLFGLKSHFQKVAAGLLVTHLLFFLFSYQASLGV